MADAQQLPPTGRASRLAPTPENLARAEGQRAGTAMRLALVVEYNLNACGAQVRQAHLHERAAQDIDARFARLSAEWMERGAGMGRALSNPHGWQLEEARRLREDRDDYWISALRHLLDALNGKGWV
jgi:hypothetical protein